jgi:hypothetical protein
MAVPADRFAASVDRLEGHERVARAVAGEPWARFRRRVLLERSAYRVLAGEAIGDVAATSGIGSQEVFTRAFRREYGANPSAWRAEPTSYLVDAPNDVHFHPPAGLRLPARQRMDGVDLVVELVEQHVQGVGELVDRAALVAEEELDRAPEDAVDPGTLRGTLSRLVDEMARLGALVHDTDSPVAEAPEGVPAMRRRLDRVGPAFVDDVSLLAAHGRLDETFVDLSSSTPRVRSYGAMVGDVLTVGAHHRLLAAARLRGWEDGR